MKTIHSDIIQFRGNHYDFGKYQGELLKDSVSLENRRNQWRAKQPRFTINAQEAEIAFRQFAPFLWDELIGLRDSLAMPLEEVLLNFGGYRTEIVPSGCSVMTGTGYMLRNYDFHPQTYDGRFVLFQPTDGGYSTVGPSSRVTGRTDGMNDQGLTVAHNFIHRKNPGDGFVCYVISRILLETCATAQEAAELLQEIPHRGSFTYTIFDRQEDSFIIEGHPRGTDVRRGTACTNHYEVYPEENRHYLKDSVDRLNAIQNAGQLTAGEAYRLFNGRKNGVFSEHYKSWAGTIHTSAYFPKSLDVWFTLGGDRKPEILDFSAWQRGVELEKERMSGEVDTEIRFAHMEKVRSKQ